MKKFELLAASAVAAIAACLISGQAYAIPLCVGPLIFNPGTQSMTSVNNNNVCVQFGDKLYGNFNLTSLIAAGGSTLVFSANGNDHNIGFDSTGTYAQGSTPSFSYEVEVTDPTMHIVSWAGDVIETTGNESTLTKTIAAVGTGTGGTINCVVNGTPVAPQVSCPQTISVNLTDATVAEAATVGTTANLSAILDTITQAAAPAVPEPASLALLGAALAGFGVFGVRRRRQR